MSFKVDRSVDRQVSLPRLSSESSYAGSLFSRTTTLDGNFCGDVKESSAMTRPAEEEVEEEIYKGLPCKAVLWVSGCTSTYGGWDGMVLKWKTEHFKHDQMFAGCGVAPEGSLRIIRSGITLEKRY
ncbi:hypothetical protein ACLB2K_071399 [Fragaria x ananassa]